LYGGSGPSELAVTAPDRASRAAATVLGAVLFVATAVVGRVKREALRR